MDRHHSHSRYQDRRRSFDLHRSASTVCRRREDERRYFGLGKGEVAEMLLPRPLQISVSIRLERRVPVRARGSATHPCCAYDYAHTIQRGQWKFRLIRQPGENIPAPCARGSSNLYRIDTLGTYQWRFVGFSGRICQVWPAPFFETVLNFDTYRSLHLTFLCAHAGTA